MSAKEEQVADYSKLLAQSARHIIVNWVTLRPIFRRIFSLRFVLILFIVFSFIDLLERIFGFVSDAGGPLSMLDSISDENTPSKIYYLIHGIFYIPFYFLLLRYLSLIRDKATSEELEKARAKGLITESEFRIKSLEIQLDDAIKAIKDLRSKGVLTRSEINSFVKLTARRYKELTQFEKLRRAKDDNLISVEEYKAKIKTISSHVEEADLLEALSASLVPSGDSDKT